jgi:hypothetical protein
VFAGREPSRADETQGDSMENEDERLRREARQTESDGSAWADRSDAFLVGYVSENRPSQFHTPALVEMQRRRIVATRGAGDCASQQTAEVINLTRALKTYTIVLTLIGVVQILLMIFKG